MKAREGSFNNRGVPADVTCADNGNGSFISSFFVHNRSWLTVAAKVRGGTGGKHRRRTKTDRYMKPLLQSTGT